MKKVTTIIPLLFLLSTQLFVFGQSEKIFIAIDDTNINLININIENGYNLPKKELLNYTENGIKETVNIEKKVHKSPCNRFYAIVNNTSKYSNGPDGFFSSSLRFLDKNGILFFEKHFPNEYLTNCLITKDGNFIFVEIGSMERNEIHVYDKYGNLQRLEEKNNSSLRASYRNKIISIKSKDIQNSNFSIDIYIDGILKSKQLSFEQYEPFVSFSSNEKIISIRDYEFYHLYNIELELVKKLSYADYIVYVFNNGENYLIQDRNEDTYCEIKDFNSDITIFKIDSIEFDSIAIPIYISNVINHGNDFYITAIHNKFHIFQFYTLEGKLINTLITDLKFMGYGALEFYKVSGEYRIRNKKYGQ